MATHRDPNLSAYRPEIFSSLLSQYATIPVPVPHHAFTDAGANNLASSEARRAGGVLHRGGV